MCSYANCNKRFTQSSNLTAHEKTHQHKEELAKQLLENGGNLEMLAGLAGDSSELHQVMAELSELGASGPNAALNYLLAEEEYEGEEDDLEGHLNNMGMALKEASGLD